MKAVKTNTKVSFYTIFKELLHEFGRSEHIGNIYANLFSLRTEEELEEDIAYIYIPYIKVPIPIGRRIVLMVGLLFGISQ